MTPEQTYLDAWQSLALRIQQGASFSGRERNCCFLNTGGSRFANVSSLVGLDHIDDSRSFAVVDWDHDGDLDLWQTNRTGPRIRYLNNELSSDTNFVAIRLIGDPSQRVNRDGVGARVHLQLSDNAGSSRTLVKTIYAGDGFLSQSSKWIHFGFGSQEKIQSVEVRWPGISKWQAFTGIVVGKRYVLNQADGTARVQKPRNPVQLASEPVQPSRSAEETRLTLDRPRPIESLWFSTIDNNQKSIDFSNSKAHLVTLWASWCSPCLKELNEFKKHHEKLRQLDVNVVALNVESLDEAVGKAKALPLVDKWNQHNKPPFEIGHAEEELIAELDEIRGDLLYGHRQLPIPCSFLIDQEGRVRSLFTGGVTVGQIEQELQFFDSSPDQLRDRAIPFAGRWSDNAFVTNPIAIAGIYREERQFADAQAYLVKFLEDEQEPLDSDKSESAVLARRRLADVHYLLGLLAMDQESTAEAISQFGTALRMNDKHWRALTDLGVAYAEMNDLAKAVEAFERSLRINPKDANGHNQLGLAKLEQRQYGDAIKHFRAVYKRWLPAANNLAWLLATCPEARHQNAMESLEIARNLAKATDSSRPDILDTLAAAYAANMEFEMAIETAEKAVKIAAEGGAEELVDEITTRLELYRQKQSYRIE